MKILVAKGKQLHTHEKKQCAAKLAKEKEPI